MEILHTAKILRHITKFVLHRVSMYYITVVPKIDVGKQESELTMEEMILCQSHHKTRDGKNQTNCT